MPPMATLIRAGVTSGSIMALSDVLAQAITSNGFSSAALEPLRTLRYLVLGLTADGPFWESAFGLCERLFGPSASAAGVTLWPVLVKKTLFTQYAATPALRVCRGAVWLIADWQSDFPNPAGAWAGAS